LIETDPWCFPDPESADAQGLLAMGGDLSPPRLLQAYRQGIFPWYESGCPILWWSPNPRLILEPQQFKLSRSLKQALKKPHQFKLDTAFEAVIRACSLESNRQGHTWILPDMIAAYTQLHQLGYAHSIEIWDQDELIGGLYGISLGRAFFGESMFHRRSNASKMALYYLCQIMQAWDYDFIDCQIPSGHLISLGALMIKRKEFLARLQTALSRPGCVGQWSGTEFDHSHQGDV
jgi:leucyl/phenylalanyl-tRNA--protein transferase